MNMLKRKSYLALFFVILCVALLPIHASGLNLLCNDPLLEDEIRIDAGVVVSSARRIEPNEQPFTGIDGNVWIDNDVVPGETYRYRFTDLDGNHHHINCSTAGSLPNDNGDTNGNGNGNGDEEEFTGLEVTYPEIRGERPEGIETEITEYLVYLFYFLVIAAGVITFVSLLRGGTMWMTSAGNPGKLREARDQLLSAIVGFVIVVSAYILLQTIDPGLVELEQVEVKPAIDMESPGVYISTADNFPSKDDEDYKDRMREEVRILRESDRNLGALSDKIRAIRIVNGYMKTPEGMAEDYYARYFYGVVLHEDAGFKGKCAYFVNQTGLSNSEEAFTMDITSADFDFNNRVISSITLLQVRTMDIIDATVYNKRGYPNPDEEDIWSEELTADYREGFARLEESELRRNVWSLEMVRENQVVILTDGEDWNSIQRCAVFRKSVPDLSGNVMNRCIPWYSYITGLFYRFRDSCTTHYAIFPLLPMPH